MSKVKVEGTVHAVGAVQSFGAKGFRKREVVVESKSGKFSDFIPVEFQNDLVDTSSDLQVDEHIVIDGFVTGRKWQRDPNSEVKYFCGVRAVSFAVNGVNQVKEPDATPAYELDDSSEIPF